MRMAVCLHGLCGGSAKYGDDPSEQQLQILDIGAKNWNRFIEAYNADLFFHTWSEECEKQIWENYKPKQGLVECWPEKIQSIENKHVKAVFSRWLSVKRVMALVEQDYDCVILSRFDLIYKLYLDYHKLDKDTLYLPFWIKRFRCKDGSHVKAEDLYKIPPEQLDSVYSIANGFPFIQGSASLMDIYMIANSDIMKRVSLLYDNLEEYVKPGHVHEVDNEDKYDTHKILTYHLFQHQIPFNFIGDDLYDAPLIRRLL